MATKKRKANGGRPHSGTKGTRYPKEVWERVRTDYEAGKYKSVLELYTSYTNAGLVCPSEQRIKMRSAKEHWTEHREKIAEEVREATHEKYLRIARERGFGDEEIIQGLINMMKAKDASERNNGYQRFYDITGIKAPHKVARTDTTGDDVPDRVVILPSNGFEAQR